MATDHASTVEHDPQDAEYQGYVPPTVAFVGLFLLSASIPRGFVAGIIP
jgi:hypothetical protein